MATDRSNACDLVDLEAPKETKLDDLRFAGIQGSQGVQCVVERDKVAAALGSEIRSAFERDLPAPSPAFFGLMSARAVHQNLAHQLRGYTEKVRPALPIGKVLRHEPKIAS